MFFLRMFFGAAFFLSVMVLGTVPVCAAEVPADAPEIQYFGRWEAENGVYRCGYGATYIKANFTGTGLKADITGAGIWWRVSIDGGAFCRLRPRGKDTILAENLPPGKHSVLLVRSTEGEAGISEFRGFSVDDGASLIAPDPLKKRRLEFVGDSILAGAMNDGKWDGSNYHDVEDNDMSFGPQLARMLGADYSVVAKSGQGVARNYDEKWPYRGVHACDSYVWAFFYEKAEPSNLMWDAKKFPVDAVILSIGTNDFFVGAPKPMEEGRFIAGYKRLIAAARKMNPGVPIICTDPVPTLIGPDAGNWVRKAVEEVKGEGEQRIWFLPLNKGKPLLEDRDYVGDRTHPTKQGSTKIAEYLKDKVAALLGWDVQP